MTIHEQAGAVLDASGRAIAPPQTALAARPLGPWDQNGVYAEFAYHQSDFEGGFFAMYTVHGGTYDKSSLSELTLQQLGIPMMPTAQAQA